MKIVTLAAIQLVLATLCAAQSARPASQTNQQLATPGAIHHGLSWIRTSPTIKNTDGPVLYQLIFGAAGIPNAVAKFDTNTRHLTNSLITDNGSFVAINALSIDGLTGKVTFAPGQNFPGTANLALNSNNLGGFAPSHYQVALSLSCPIGTALTSISPGGQGQCSSTTPPPQTNPPANLIFSGQAFFLEVIAGKDGFPAMSYEDANGVPHYTHCHDYLCSTYSTVVIDSGVTTPGTGTSLYTDTLFGFPDITYQSASTNGTLKLAQCNNADCSGPIISSFDVQIGRNVGQYNSVYSDNGNGIVASYQDGNGFLKLAECSALLPGGHEWTCSPASNLLYATPDSVNGPVVNTYMGYDALNTVAILYENNSHQLRIATCTFNVYNCNASSGSVQNTVLDTSANFVGTNATFVQNTLGNLLITYERQPGGATQPSQALIVCGSSSSHCTSAGAPQALPFTFPPSGPAQITIGNDGLPIIAVLIPTINAIGIYHCSDSVCTSGTATNVNIPGVTAITAIAMTIGGDGFPAVTYSATNNNLPAGQNVGIGLLHCGNASCNAYSTLSRR